MWTRSAQRLRSRGLDQWQYPVKWHNIRRTVTNGTCWLVTDTDGRTIGTITLEPTADPYWHPSDDPDNALYVHRMVVDDGARGSELGSALLDWAARRARKAGRAWLRLDAWKSNPGLHRYYLDRGFSLVRIDDNPSDPAGALFQRSANIELHRGPNVLDDSKQYLDVAGHNGEVDNRGARGSLKEEL
jgi:GNAT superfamily N-acetyltransferase